MRRLAKCGAEKPMEMKLGKTSFARRLLQQNAGLVFGREQVPSATEPSKCVVMQKLRHERMILAFAQECHPRTPCAAVVQDREPKSHSGNPSYLRNIKGLFSRDFALSGGLFMKLVYCVPNHGRGTRRLPLSSHSTRPAASGTTGPVPRLAS